MQAFSSSYNLHKIQNNMKDSSQLRKEFDKLKEAYENAQKRKKKAKSAYKSQMKALKSQLKPYRLSYKQAQLAEHEAKLEYKTLLNKLKRKEDEGFEMTASASQTTITAETPVERKKRGPKPKAERQAAPEKPVGRGRGRQKAATPAPTSEGDDLTRVVGVGAKVAAVLQANGINSFADMAATSLDRYKQILKENGMGMFRNPSTWAQQAADLAGVEVTAPAPAPPAPKEPKRRGRQPGAAKAAEPKTGKRGRKPGAAPAEKGAPRRRAAEPVTTGGGDDLTRVVGVGDKVAVALQASGINSFAEMAATPLARYKEILKENGMSKFRNPTTWAQQAADLAGVEVISEPAAAPAPPKEKGRRGRKPAEKAVVVEATEQPKRRPGRQPGFKPTPKAKTVAAPVAPAAEGEPVKKRRGRQPGFKPTPKAKTVAAPVVVAPTAEGEPAKKRRGRQPGFKPAPRVKAATSSEPVIAESLQRSRSAAKKGSQVEAAPAPRNIPGSVKVDDLTKIKGIGDRVQNALYDFGIYTYEDVAGTSLDRFKEILKARGMSKFRDPSSWAQLAGEITGR